MIYPSRHYLVTARVDAPGFGDALIDDVVIASSLAEACRIMTASLEDGGQRVYRCTGRLYEPMRERIMAARLEDLERRQRAAGIATASIYRAAE